MAQSAVVSGGTGVSKVINIHNRVYKNVCESQRAQSCLDCLNGEAL